GEVVFHRRFGRLKIFPAGFPGLWLSLPPGHRLRIGDGAWQRFEVRGERADQSLVWQVGGRAEAEHRVHAGDRPVSLHISADVNLTPRLCPNWPVARRGY